MKAISIISFLVSVFLASGAEAQTILQLYNGGPEAAPDRSVHGGQIQNPVAASSPTKTPRENPAKKPYLLIYTADWCGGCRYAKSILSQSEYSWFDVHEVTNIPSWVTSLPTFHWNDSNGNGKKISGFDNQILEFLVSEMRDLKVEETAFVVSDDADSQPTPYDEVHRILKLLSPNPHETFVDFGCGDARFCIAASSIYGCKSIGIEIDPGRAAAAKIRVAALGLSDLVTIIEGDATKVDVDADVGVAYLWPDVLGSLRQRLIELDRFASYQHQVPGVSMSKNGDVFLWDQSTHRQYEYQQASRSTPVATWNGYQYTGRVCGSRSCSMCNSIEAQLRRQTR